MRFLDEVPAPDAVPPLPLGPDSHPEIHPGTPDDTPDDAPRVPPLPPGDEGEEAQPPPLRLPGRPGVPERVAHR